MVASATISNFVNCKQLDERNIRYTLKQGKGVDSGFRYAHICIHTSSIIKSNANWAMDSLRLNYVNLTSDGKIRVVVEGQAKEPMTQLKMKDMSASDSDISFHPPTGSFALRFTITVGDGVIEQVIEHLQSIERLISFVSVIRRSRLSCQHVSLGRIVFVYDTKPIRTAEITFSGDNLRLIIPRNSPHARISQFLDELLNKKGLESVILQLVNTTSILVALDEIESKTPEGVVNIATRGIEWYRLYYPFQRNHIVDIQLKLRKSRMLWFIKDGNVVRPPQQPGQVQPEQLNPHDPAAHSPLRPFYVDDSTPGIEGLRSGSAATPEMIGVALNRVHSILCPEYGKMLNASGQSS